jgi:pimeloyl-ACP methyl ester carboxylesterase
MSFPDGIAGSYEGDGRGQPFLWAHGLTSSRADEDRSGLMGWSGGFPGWRVVRWDAPGHGESRGATSDQDTEWPRLAEVLLEVADDHGVDRFVAGGASMGCATALWAAVTAPERIDAMVLAIPPTGWDTRPAQADRYRSGTDLLDREGIVAFADHMVEEPLPPVFQPYADAVNEARRAGYLAGDPTSLAHVLRGAAASDLPPLERLADLGQPTLILAWAGDPGHPLSSAEALASALPNTQLHVAETIRDVFAWRDHVATFLADLGG